MNPLVTSSWLAEHLNDPDVVVLDATLPPVGSSPAIDTRARYIENHIPGAVFFDIEQLSDHSTPLPHMLPTPENFSRDMSALGIGDQMLIVIYEQEGVFSAPRAWWMFRTFGAPRVVILDGGLHAWVQAGLPTKTGHTSRPPAVFRAHIHHEAVTDYATIQQLITSHAQILDARSSGRFAGTLPEPRPGLESGHMPGAKNTPYTELLDHGRLQSTDRLREYFKAKEVDLEKPIVTTCGSGVTAAVIALGLEIAGAKQISLYDGSWAEYAQRPESVVAKTI